MTTRTLELDSPAQLAATLQVPVSKIMRVAEGLRLRPTIRLDGRPLYDARAAEAIRAYLVRKHRADA